MHPRQAGIKDFLSELNGILVEMYEQTGMVYSSDVVAWYKNTKVLPGRTKQGYSRGTFPVVEEYLGGYAPYMYNRISCSRFVYIKDLSLRNFLLGIFKDNCIYIKKAIVQLPVHSDLKEFLVPEDLILPENQGRIFNLDWIN